MPYAIPPVHKPRIIQVQWLILLNSEEGNGEAVSEESCKTDKLTDSFTVLGAPQGFFLWITRFEPRISLPIIILSFCGKENR